MTVYSPRGLSISSITSVIGPLTNCSWILVTSRQMNTSRSPRVDTTSLNMLRIRWGDSKTTSGLDSVDKELSHLFLSLDLEGGNPTNVKGPPHPVMTTAARMALAPGTAWTGIPPAMASRTKRAPGSERSGVPASETRATESPRWSRRRRPGPFLDSLCSWKLVVGVGMPLVGQQLSGATGVLGGNDGDILLKHAEGPDRDVFQVPDRGGDDVERAGWVAGWWCHRRRPEERGHRYCTILLERP